MPNDLLVGGFAGDMRRTTASWAAPCTQLGNESTYL
jgi:hypothetical protein